MLARLGTVKLLRGLLNSREPGVLGFRSYRSLL